MFFFSLVKGFNYQDQTYTVTMQSSVCSDSETSTISQGSFVNKTTKQPQQYDHRPMNGTFTLDTNSTTFKQQQYQQKPSGEDSEYYNEEELWRLMDVDNHPDRPSHLDLAGNSGYTPIVSRKPMFQFSGKFLLNISLNGKKIILNCNAFSI